MQYMSRILTAILQVFGGTHISSLLSWVLGSVFAILIVFLGSLLRWDATTVEFPLRGLESKAKVLAFAFSQDNPCPVYCHRFALKDSPFLFVTCSLHVSSTTFQPHEHPFL